MYQTTRDNWKNASRERTDNHLLDGAEKGQEKVQEVQVRA